MYLDVLLYIGGRWRVGEPIGTLSIAEAAVLKDAAADAAAGPKVWRGMSAYERGKILKRAEVTRASGVALECGMVSINHYGPSLPETPFVGVKDSGIGSEGGREGMASYMVTKFVTQLVI